jgi:YbbR domain-containing protein
MKLPSRARLQQQIRRIPIENKGLKLLSLGLAMLLFAVSRQPITDIHLRGVSIEYRGVAKGVEILATDDDTETAELLLRGPRDVMRNLTASQLAVIADLTQKDFGERVVPLNIDESSLPDSVQVVGIEPSSIKLKIERTTRKSVSLEPQLTGQPPAGLEVYSVSALPQTVEIEGPQSLVDKTTFLSTESVSLSGRRASFSVPVVAEPPNSSLRIKSTSAVNLKIEIGERRVNRTLANVIVRWPDPPEDGQLLTKTVSVELFGPESVVQSVRAEDVVAEIKTATLPTDPAELATPEIVLPVPLKQQIAIKNILPKGVKVKR